MFEEIEELKRQKEENERNKTFNGLTAHEWALYTQSVFALQGVSARNELRLKHGATYPNELTDRLIKMYSHEGDLIFDPFLGIGTTLMSAMNLNRRGIGIELSQEFCQYAIRYLQLDNEMIIDRDIKIYNDDCRNLEKYVDDESIQATITSPPYANFIHKVLNRRSKTKDPNKSLTYKYSTVRKYTDLPEDFGNLSYNEFILDIKQLLEKIYKKTKKYGYSVWVVRDFREKGSYVNFHTDLAEAGKQKGFKWIDLVVWDQSNSSATIVGYPRTFYTNMRLSYIVVLRKE